MRTGKYCFTKKHCLPLCLRSDTVIVGHTNHSCYLHTYFLRHKLHKFVPWKWSFRYGKVIHKQHVLKVTSVFTNAHTQLKTPLSDSLPSDHVVDAIPFFNKTLLKVVDTFDPGTVDSSLQHAQTLQWSGLRSWLLDGHNHSGRCMSRLCHGTDGWQKVLTK